MDFKVPKKEQWVKQVMVGDTSEINVFFVNSVKTQQIRGVGILGIMKDKIVVVYEKDINA